MKTNCWDKHQSKEILGQLNEMHQLIAFAEAIGNEKHNFETKHFKVDVKITSDNNNGTMATGQSVLTF